MMSGNKFFVWIQLLITARCNGMLSESRNWMGKLPESVKLGDLILPGSHDAGIHKLKNCHKLCEVLENCKPVASYTQTQRLNMMDQLKAGSRFFDIRPIFHKDKGLFTYHRFMEKIGCDGERFESVLDYVVNFLDEEPTETLILRISHFSGEMAPEVAFYDLMEPTFQRKMYKNDSEVLDLSQITLGELRGKVLVIHNKAGLVDHSKGLFRFSRSPSEGGDLVFRGSYSNKNEFGDMQHDQLIKWKTFHDSQLESSSSDLFILYWTLTYNLHAFMSLDHESIEEKAVNANDILHDELTSVLNDYGWRKPNVVLVDYVEPRVARDIYSYNFPSQKGKLERKNAVRYHSSYIS